MMDALSYEIAKRNRAGLLEPYFGWWHVNVVDRNMSLDSVPFVTFKCLMEGTRDYVEKAMHELLDASGSDRENYLLLIVRWRWWHAFAR